MSQGVSVSPSVDMMCTLSFSLLETSLLIHM